jgi:Zn-finger nucleic acid-binding protein
VSTAQCPYCEVLLRPVSARARSGYLLPLDQCPQCGGLWCDRWELFPLHAAEVDRLDPVDQPALWASVAPVGPERNCPRCSVALQRFVDPLLPDDVRIERCRMCEGMWLNRGELRRFKARDAREPRPRSLDDDRVRLLAERLAGSERWATVANLDRAAAPATEADHAEEGIAGGLMRGVGWIALRALLRLLLRC